MTNLVPPSVTATVDKWITYAEALEAKVSTLEDDAVGFWKGHEVAIIAGVIGAIAFWIGHVV